MRSPQECRDRADALSRSAAGCTDPGLSLQLEATAAEWRKLSDFAHRQDTFLLSLAEPGE